MKGLLPPQHVPARVSRPDTADPIWALKLVRALLWPMELTVVTIEAIARLRRRKGRYS
jgi:hypothetical protein